MAALERGRRQLAKRLRPDPKLDPEAQLDVILDSFLDYVEEHASAYTTIFNWRGGDPEIAAVLDAGRNEQLETVMRALKEWEESPFSKEPSAAQQAAVQGWLFFVEGAVLSWLENGAMERPELRKLLRLALGGALWAAEASAAPMQSVNPP